MTPGQLIDLLADAGMLKEESPGVFGWHPTMEKAERFRASVAAAERERFAEECIDLVALYGGPVDLEAAIRARGETK